jgi:hypothetical protein
MIRDPASGKGGVFAAPAEFLATVDAGAAAAAFVLLKPWQHPSEAITMRVMDGWI